VKIFFPFHNPENLFLDELEQYSQDQWIFDEYSAYSTDYDIVWIHWPEAIFKWKEPTDDELNAFEADLLRWKKHSAVIYTRHNYYPHNKSSRANRQLYDMILQNADCIVHLGEYSMHQLKSSTEAPNEAKQVMIPHHIYTLYPNDVDKWQARAALGISRDSKVLLVFGAIRSSKERKFMLTVFRRLTFARKVLLAPRMVYYVQTRQNGGIARRLQKYLTRATNLVYSFSSHYKFDNVFVDNNMVQYYCNSADAMFIPRRKSLNSGLALLGLSFRIPVLGRDIGNISEVLKNSGNFTYAADSSVHAADVISELFNESVNYQPDQEYINSLHPKIVAQQYTNLFRSMLKT
jgi:hypothetical protein